MMDKFNEEIRQLVEAGKIEAIAAPPRMEPAFRPNTISSNPTYNITLNAGAFMGTRADASRFVDFIIGQLRAKQRYALGAATW
jgi:hypothetical protein